MDQLETVLKAPVVLVHGSDSGLLRRKVSAIKAELENQGLLEESESLPGSSDPKEWVAAAQTLPFFSDRRVVIVSNIFAGDKKKLEATPWAEVPASGLLLLIAGVESGDPDKVRPFLSQAQSFSKVISKAGGKVIDTELAVKDGPRLLQDAANSGGKKLSPKVCELLLEMTGNCLGDALDELDKLIVYLGDEPEIRQSDVQAVVIPNREWNVFQLVDGVSQGNTGKALRQLKSLIVSPGSLSETAFRSLLPMLSRQISLLWQAKICLEMREHIERPSEKFMALLPEKPRLTDLREFQLRPILGTAGKVKFEQLSNCFQMIAAADGELKGALPAFSPTETLERLVVQMSEEFAPASAGRY